MRDRGERSGMGRNDGKGKSLRKPLREVTNHRRTNSSKSLRSKKPPETETETLDPVDGDAVRHLLLVHSDISATLHQESDDSRELKFKMIGKSVIEERNRNQYCVSLNEESKQCSTITEEYERRVGSIRIDELVVQAVEVRATSKNGRKEIESFAHVLSEILSSLKPWVPRFQKVLSASSTECETQLTEALASGIDNFISEDANHGDESPEPSKLESLVSPSPLVSWRAADCSVEQNKQLFLLTPLPRPGKSMTKGQPLSKSMTFEKAGVYSLFVDNSDGTFGILRKSTSENLPNSIAKDKENGQDLGFLSPPMFPKKDFSMIVTTPCLKVSPPKSCALLEPNCDFPRGNFDKFHKSTPFPVGKQSMSESPDSETTSSELSDSFGLKYTTLFGIKPASISRNGRKQLEASPAWFMSPPKTCTLMEPSYEKCLNDATLISSQQIDLVPCKVNDGEGNCQQTEKLASHAYHGGSFALVQSTPMCKASESAMRTGKHPGENTLKKELWMKFEAASTKGLHLNFSLFQRTAQKGFLDRLEEASCDER